MTSSLVQNMSSVQAWEMLKSDDGVFLIDVRSQEEWEETGIADLSSIEKDTKLLTLMFFTPSPHMNDKFTENLESMIPNKDSTLLFICKSGGRSKKAAEFALNLGYKNCYNIEDGFVGNMFDNNLNPISLNGWINNNLPRKAL